jgi:hypothetical protein
VNRRFQKENTLIAIFYRGVTISKVSGSAEVMKLVSEKAQTLDGDDALAWEEGSDTIIMSQSGAKMTLGRVAPVGRP